KSTTLSPPDSTTPYRITPPERKPMPQEATQALAQFAAALRFEDLPQDVRDHCKNVLLDTLACALAGHQGEETHQVAALASALAQSDKTNANGGSPLAPP